MSIKFITNKISRCTELLLILLMVAMIKVSFGQPSNLTEKDIISKAKDFFAKKDYQGAMSLYAQLVSVHPDDPEFNLRFGECKLFGDRKDKKSPIRYLNIAAKTLKDDPALLYDLGLAYHQNQEFANAMKYYNLYLGKLAASDPNRQHILELVNQCLNGINLADKNLISQIISSSEYQKDNFHRAYRADELDGMLLLKPENLQSNREKKANMRSFVFVTEPRNILYYAGYENEQSNNLDIFKVSIDEKGNWGKPEKLPSEINTLSDENYPVLTNFGTTLYFCSKGRNTLGGYDIFKTEIDTAKNTYSEPENMGPGINSPFDDILFIPAKDKGQAYFASDRDDLNGAINVYKVKLIGQGDENNMVAQNVKNDQSQNISEQKKTVSENTSTIAGNQHPAHKVAENQIVTDPSKRASEILNDRTKSHLLADSAYRMITEIKDLVRNLTNKRDRANSISQRKTDEARTMESRFQDGIAKLAIIKDEKEFNEALGRAVKLKEETFQLYSRANQANLIAWLVGKQIKNKNQELEDLKMIAGKIQSSSVSATFEETLILYTGFRNNYIKADTLTEFSEELTTITNNATSYEVPKTEYAFVDKLKMGFKNNTLLADTKTENPSINPKIPIVVVDKRTIASNNNNSVSEPPAKPVIKLVKQAEQIPLENLAIADVQTNEEALEINFSIDNPVIVPAKVVEPVYYDQLASGNILFDEDEIEINFIVDTRIPEIIQPIYLEKMAYADPINDEGTLDISFAVDKPKIVVSQVADQIDINPIAFNDIPDEDHLEINFNADKPDLIVPDVVKQVSVGNLAFDDPGLIDENLEINYNVDRKTVIALKNAETVDVNSLAIADVTPDEGKLEINFSVDQKKAVAMEIVHPVDVNELEDNDLVLSDDHLEINFNADKPNLVVLKNTIPVDLASVTSTEVIQDEGSLDINFNVDKKTPVVSKMVEPVSNDALAYNEMSVQDEPLDMNFAIDKKNPVKTILAVPVNLSSLALNDVVQDDDKLDINFSADEIDPVNIADQVETVNLNLASYNAPSLMDDKLEIKTDIEKVFMATKIVQPVYNTDLASNTVFGDEGKLNINFNADKKPVVILPVVQPVKAESFALNDEIVDEEHLELNFTADTKTEIAANTSTIGQNKNPIDENSLVNSETEKVISTSNMITNQAMKTFIAQPVQIGSYDASSPITDDSSLEIDFAIDKPQVTILKQVEEVYPKIAYNESSLSDDKLDIVFDSDKNESSEILPLVQQVNINAIDSEFTGVRDEKLEIAFSVDRSENYKILNQVEEISYNGISEDITFNDEEKLDIGLVYNEATHMITIDSIPVAKSNYSYLANDFKKSENANISGLSPVPGTYLYLRESVEKAKTIESNKSDKEILVLALTDPDQLSYEELLYAASLANSIRQKLSIYNLAFIHIDRDWRAFNNAGVTAINGNDLDQAECYLYQASLITSDNGGIENNLGIVACYKKQFDKAEEYFMAASKMGFDAKYNLQVVYNIINDFKNSIDKKSPARGGVRDVYGDVIDYGTKKPKK